MTDTPSGTISNTTCCKCQHCGQWTNHADDPYFKALVRREAEMRALLERAHEHVCSLVCPSVFKTGSPMPHSDLCDDIRVALGKADPAGGPRRQELETVMWRGLKWKPDPSLPPNRLWVCPDDEGGVFYVLVNEETLRGFMQSVPEEA